MKLTVIYTRHFVRQLHGVQEIGCSPFRRAGFVVSSDELEVKYTTHQFSITVNLQFQYECLIRCAKVKISQ